MLLSILHRQELEKWLKIVCELTKLDYKREKVHDWWECTLSVVL
jgi:hypothetical protein